MDEPQSNLDDRQTLAVLDGFSPEKQLVILRRFEPVIRYTRGEMFFPMRIEPYIAACSLWVHQKGKADRCIVPQGRVNLQELAKPQGENFNAVQYLRFIEPLELLKLIDYLRSQRRNRNNTSEFRRGYGRLARVGYSSRFADLLFSLSLLLRGRVPGDASAAAALEYQRIIAERKHYSYYGRVFVLQNWIVLQYWYFYAFNNWRSAFFGVNDHEADWEMVNVYLWRDDHGELHPEWVAYAAHDFSGDDLRRRWDDPELQKEGEHPIIFAGAGSHASYYKAGEYLAEIPMSFLTPIVRLIGRVQNLWRGMIGQIQDEEPADASLADKVQGGEQDVGVFRVPFVDYARGDGFSLGPGQEREWDPPALLDTKLSWVSQYRGLWGLFARDPISGENAPAGPMFNRDGTMRQAWYDPLGWCGLDKVLPPPEALRRLRQDQSDLAEQRVLLAQEIEQKGQELSTLGLRNAAIQGKPHFRSLDVEHHKQIQLLSAELGELQSRQAANAALLEAMRAYELRVLAGEHGSPREHIRRSHRPASENELHASRVVEFWAAISIGLLMIGFVLLTFIMQRFVFLGVIVLVSVFVLIESSFRRQVSQLINSVTVGLAIVCTLIVFYEYFGKIIAVAILAAGIFILWENIKELRR
jgi:hypothetical protein